MTYFHTSPEKIEKINKYGMFGECLFFSADVYSMSNASKYIYKLEIAEEDIIAVSSFFFQDNCEVLNPIVEDIMKLAECDRETAENLLDQSERHEDYEIDWAIQGFGGDAAKLLGFKAAKAYDEQGAVYIVPMFNREKELEEIEVN